MANGTEGLLLQLFTIFVWAKVFGELFERLYLPAVLGEILAGIVLGPYATQFVLPTPTVYSIAEIGAVFLLFTVGLETSPKDLISVSRLSLRVAAGGVALPFIAGFWLMRADGQPVHEAAFVAAAMVATRLEPPPEWLWINSGTNSAPPTPCNWPRHWCGAIGVLPGVTSFVWTGSCAWRRGRKGSPRWSCRPSRSIICSLLTSIVFP